MHYFGDAWFIEGREPITETDLGGEGDNSHYCYNVGEYDTPAGCRS